MRRTSWSCVVAILALGVGACGAHSAGGSGQAGAGSAGAPGAAGAGSAGAGTAGAGAAGAGTAGAGVAGAGVAGASGGACRPVPSDAWLATSTANGPTAAQQKLVVWTGKVLAVFTAIDGGVFDPCTNTWRRASLAGMPPQLVPHGEFPTYKPLVIGDRLVMLFPGSDANPSAQASTVSAAVYDLAADKWTTSPLAGAPKPRDSGVVVSTGKEAILWSGSVSVVVDGGSTSRTVADGARFDPVTGQWTPIATAGAPVGRTNASAIWTGARFVVFGGNTNLYGACLTPGSCAPAAAGGAYDPATDTWQLAPDAGAPTLVEWPRVSSNGKRVVVWQHALAGGHGVYDPIANRWEAMPDPTGLLSDPRFAYLSQFVGDRLAVSDSTGAAVYDLAAKTWTPVAAAKLPDASLGATVLGGDGLVLGIGTATGGAFVQTTVDSDGKVQGGWMARLDVARARWELATLPVAGSPDSLAGVFAWTGERLIEWGGARVVYDPMGRTGCENPHPGFGCDPHFPTKQLYDSAGGLLTPAFAPAP